MFIEKFEISNSHRVSKRGGLIGKTEKDSKKCLKSRLWSAKIRPKKTVNF